jgi:hypothetical protein
MRYRELPRGRALAAAGLLVAGLCVVAGCASTRVNAEWTDPQFAGRSLRGQLVLVLCDANDTAVQRICEDRLAASLTASGVTPVRGGGDLTLGPPPANDRTIAAARKANAKAILGARVAPDATVINPGPSVSFGLGGFSGSRGGVSGGGVGVGMPVGGGQVDTAYGADLTLTDVETVKLMWTGKVSAPASGNVNTQMGELARVGIEAAARAGFF